MEAGHYITYCHNTDEQKWYKFNDDTCNIISNAENLNKSFILMYILIE